MSCYIDICTLVFVVLGNLDTIDIDKLDELEQNIDDAEDQFLQANIEVRFNQLMTSRHQQMIWVRDYTAELLQLQRDVENIRQINATIPRDCFKKITLEPTDPTG